MCGITGFIDHTQSITESHLTNASTSIKHRGGNGQGIIFEQKGHYTLGLANERLATIDLSEKAQQPLTSHCGNYCITFNGTIYNYLELREMLIKYGIIFYTLTDTEVILEAYKKWGNKAFEKLDGSFAFVIWDKKQNQLLVARDEIGAKPLFYFQDKGFYAFGSEIRALLCYPTVEKKINKNALANYFRFGYFTGEQTIYEQIHKHKKGIIKVIDLHSGNSYDLPISRNKLPLPITEELTEAQILAKTEELLTEAILKRNVADVPTGVLLSGGYDSATVAAILQKNQTKRIRTFTVGFTDGLLDEAPQAKKIAEHLKTNHHQYYLEPNDALMHLKKLPEIFDEPMGNSSAIALSFIAEKAQKEVKVLLGAEGGDELFGGYRTYAKAIRFNELHQKKIPSSVQRIVLKLLQSIKPQWKEIWEAEGLLNKYLAVNACYTTPQIERLLNSNVQSDDAGKTNATDIKGLLLYDLHNYLPNNILQKSDRCFMHYGIDNRDAILKTELAEFLITLDPKWFIKDGQQKYLLKKITNQYIPAYLIKSPKKGFVVPLASWLKSTFRPLINEYLSKEKLDQHQLFNLKEVEKMRSAFYRNSTAYNAQQLWLLLQFQMWYERWMRQW